MEKTSRLLCLFASIVLAACGPEQGSGDVDSGTDDAGFVDAGEGDGGTDGGDVDGGTDGGETDGGDGGQPIELKVRAIVPPRGGLAGGTVVAISGAGFVDGFAEFGGRVASEQTKISFGGNAAIDVNVIDDDTIEVRTPSGARGQADVVVENPNGKFTCEKCFTFFEAVELARIEPAQGSTAGGEQVTLTGKGFVEGVLVLVGGSAATDVAIATDGRTLTARTPPGVAGSADVAVVGANSAAFLRRGFVFVAPMRIAMVTPPSASLDGLVDVTIRGEGFTADSAVSFDGAAVATTFVSDTELKVKSPAAQAAGAVDVSVAARRGSAELKDGFSYFDAATRSLALVGISPRQGPVAGGTCADGSGCVHLYGSGFVMPELSVRIGGRDATFRIVDEHHLEVDLPAGDAGLADVQARSPRGAAVLTDAFAYVVPLGITAISPAVANATGTPVVQATVTGSGFAAGCDWRIGAGEAAVATVSDDGSEAVLTVPPGSPGARDVTVSCGDPGTLSYQRAVLAGGFTYASPLELLQVDPDNGAIAGNTAVTLFGSGFAPDMEIIFGRSRATSVEVKSPHLAIARTPRGDVGPVNVTVRRGFIEDVLPAGYAYIDPTNILGGASGGPMRGTLNVTVLNQTPGMSGPVDGVNISINNDQLIGVTDARGQVTFSDPALLKPVTITGKKPKFAAATIARVDARNVTLYMEMNEGDGEPSPPPPPPPPATFTGRVCGFKVPPGIQLARGQRLEARVYMSAPYVYAAPPFRELARPSVVSTDCGSYSIVTRRYGPLALYAEFGIVDANQSPATFTPLLMGIRRGLEAAPDKVTENADIVLDMHRDVSVPITIEPAEAPAGQSVVNLVFSYLDLGGEGVIPLAQAQSIDNDFVFERHPRVGGEGIMFLNLAALLDLLTGQVNPPYSFYYRRQYGELAAGVEIGPMLAFTRLQSPSPGGTFTGSLAWGFTNGQKPDLQQIYVEQPQGFSSKPIWNVILPGTEQGVALPPSVLSTLESGTMLFWTVMTSRSPRFDYNRFGYQQLGVTAWTAFTQDGSSFTTP